MCDQNTDVSVRQSQRGGFTFNDKDNTGYDPRTDLTWFRNADSWNGPMKWCDADNKIKIMNIEKIGGFTTWRLPTVDELKAISIYAQSAVSGNNRNNILSEYFNDIGFDNVMPDWYWSSTPHIGTPDKDPYKSKWCINMKELNCEPFETDYKCYVWPVRDAD